MQNFKLPSNVTEVLKTLEANGFEGYIVGGCVRDILLGKTPNDWDITTSALPEHVIELFPRTVDIGKLHGTIGVIFGKDEIIEVTTYRIDGEYIDNRRPETVTFTPNLSDDLARRDFTINSLAYNEISGIIDLFDGINDLSNKTIRCVGNANKRFQEDALRMLRAIRFAAKLGFTIENDTYNAIINNAELIQNISVERIRIEFDKILLSDNPQMLVNIVDTRLYEFFFPNLGETDSDTLAILRKLPKNLNIRLASLGESILELLIKLKYDNETKNAGKTLVKYHDLQIEPTKISVKRAIQKVGEEYFLDLLQLKNANDLREIYFEIKKNREPLSTSELAIDGQDLIQLGIKEGKQIGESLKHLLDLVLENSDLNNREALIEKVGEIRGNS